MNIAIEQVLLGTYKNMGLVQPIACSCCFGGQKCGTCRLHDVDHQLGRSRLQVITLYRPIQPTNVQSMAALGQCAPHCLQLLDPIQLLMAMHAGKACTLVQYPSAPKTYSNFMCSTCHQQTLTPPPHTTALVHASPTGLLQHRALLASFNTHGQDIRVIGMVATTSSRLSPGRMSTCLKLPPHHLVLCRCYTLACAGPAGDQGRHVGISEMVPWIRPMVKLAASEQIRWQKPSQQPSSLDVGCCGV